MNSTIYLFGDFGQGITATVNDYTNTFFKEFILRSNAPTQIIIHRYGNVMNYGYVRKIDNEHLFGVCVQINGQYLITTNKLFEVFESIIANISVKGEILSLNRNGDIVVVETDVLCRHRKTEAAIANCENEISILDAYCVSLPDIDVSTTDYDVYYFKDSDDANAIVGKSVKNGYVFIYKEQDYDTLALGGYRSTLLSLNNEIEGFKKTIKEQRNQLKILERKKKQMGVVFGLLITLFVGFVIFVNTIEEKNEDIQVKERTIDEQMLLNHNLSEENIGILKGNN